MRRVRSRNLWYAFLPRSAAFGEISKIFLVAFGAIDVFGGFQLLDLIIRELKSHMT